jgi:hypothetical protein
MSNYSQYEKTKYDKELERLQGTDEDNRIRRGLVAVAAILLVITLIINLL